MNWIVDGSNGIIELDTRKSSLITCLNSTIDQSSHPNGNEESPMHCTVRYVKDITSVESTSEANSGFSLGLTKASQFFNTHSHFVSVLHILSVGRLAKLDWQLPHVSYDSPIILAAIFLLRCGSKTRFVRSRMVFQGHMADNVEQQIDLVSTDIRYGPGLDCYAASGMVFERAWLIQDGPSFNGFDDDRTYPLSIELVCFGCAF